MDVEQTLVLIKPDGVKRGLIGEVIKRFEQRGLKIVALRLTKVNREFAKKHYTDDVEKRRGKEVRDRLIEYILDEPIVAIVIEGVNAISNVRKICGDTESKSAMPGTIRGDYSHVSYKYADDKKIAVKNIIHASSNQDDAKYEINLWFPNKNADIHKYKLSADEHFL